MKTRPNLMACEQKERNATSDCMWMKLTNFWLKTFAIALITFSSLSSGSYVMKENVFILIPKTTTAIS